HRRATAAHTRRAAQEPSWAFRQRPQLEQGAVAMTRLSARHAASAVMLLVLPALAGCATSSAKVPDIRYDDRPVEIAATPAPEPPRPVEVVTIPEPLPLPGQLKPVTDTRRAPEPADPRRRVGAANTAARI